MSANLNETVVPDRPALPVPAKPAATEAVAARPRLVGRGRVVLALVAVASLAVAVWLHRQALVVPFSRVEWSPIWLLPVGLFVLQAWLAAIRSVVLLGGEAWPRLGACLRCHLGARLAGQAVPAETTLIARCTARHLGRAEAEVAGTLRVDRALDVLLGAGVAPVAVLYLAGRLDLESALGLAAILAALLPPAVHALLQPLLSGLVGAPGAERAGGLSALYRAARPALAWAYALTLLRYGVLVWGLGVLQMLLLGDPAWAAMALATAPFLLAWRLPLTPAGLGLVEACWTGLLLAAGAGLGTALAFAFCVRGYILAGSLAAALPALALPRPAR